MPGRVLPRSRPGHVARDAVIEGWELPLASVLGVGLWASVAWIARHEPWAPLVWVILTAAIALLVASLIYPRVISPEGSRIAASTERIILLLTGAWALVFVLRATRR